MRTLLFFLGSALLSVVNAECPNACSSHGRCSSYDMCLCYRNWMSNDCSERVCQFGLAHVDTPKGDLDASSGALSGPDVLVIPNSEMYPYGTSEQFPKMVTSNGTGDDDLLANTAHYYMECSNKGICDRSAGVCECFPGYEGSACQRASCPSNDNGVCNGHGTCQNIKKLADNDYNNIYELWDKTATLGCNCDPGYYGADCTLRQCKYGADPLYHDDSKATLRYANWTFVFYSDVAGSTQTPAGPDTPTGNYSIIFHDVFGEDWETEFIDWNDGCDEIIARLEQLPNDVIKGNSVNCYNYPQMTTEATPVLTDDFTVKGFAASSTILKKFVVTFPENVGILKQPSVNMYLDGARATLESANSENIHYAVYADGFYGEFEDLVPDLCEGVIVTLMMDGPLLVLAGEQNPLLPTPATASSDLTPSEINKIKRCLGDSDWDTTNNKETHNLDFGDESNLAFPHLIKLTDVDDTHKSKICNTTDTDMVGVNRWCDDIDPAGFYAVIAWDDSADQFVVYGSPLKHFGRIEDPPSSGKFRGAARFNLFTTTGRLSKRGKNMNGGPTILPVWTYPSLYSNTLYFDAGEVYGEDALDCEQQKNRANFDGTDCIEKGDRVMLLDSEDSNVNSFAFPNIYTVEKISVNYEQSRLELVLDMGVNMQDMSGFFVYKFESKKTASWAAPCSDRGVCDTSSGLCKCFPGYTSDDCSVQNILAQ